MIIKPLEKHYRSEIDHFLSEFDTLHPEKSLSQQAEIAKQQKIATLRDQIQHEATTDPFDF